MPKKSSECLVAGCGQPFYAKGYCNRHYTQVLRHGRLTPEKERGKVKICQAPGCARTDCIGDYCKKHYRQIRKHGHLTPEREHGFGISGCSYPGCRNPHRAKGLCSRHYFHERYIKSSGK
ncbi:MAG: hypothetical protein ACYS8W_08590 [Planctomycetota bacterium]